MGKTTIVFNNHDEASLLKIIADLENQLKAQQKKTEKAAEQVFYYQEIIDKLIESLQKMISDIKNKKYLKN